MYETFYNLHGKPFQLNPDPRFFYGSRGHKRAMAYLEYGLDKGEGFIVITGEVGAGKTTLVRNLFQGLDRERLVAAELVSTQLDADDMLRMVAGAFGLSYQGVTKAAILSELQSFLIQQHRDGKRTLLVVDEAQNLSPAAVEELRMLSNFQDQGESLLQSFLLGQPEFRQTLQSPRMQQLRQRVTASYHLGPMDLAETKAYIEHRLHTVGWDGNPTLTWDTYSAIYECSGGIPRRINTVCDRLLLMGYLEETHVLSGAMVSEVAQELKNDLESSGASEPVPAKGNAKGNGQDRAAIGPPPEDDDRVMRLETRITEIEQSVIYLLRLSRRILAAIDYRRAGNNKEQS